MLLAHTILVRTRKCHVAILSCHTGRQQLQHSLHCGSVRLSFWCSFNSLISVLSHSLLILLCTQSPGWKCVWQCFHTTSTLFYYRAASGNRMKVKAEQDSLHFCWNSTPTVEDTRSVRNRCSDSTHYTVWTDDVHAPSRFTQDTHTHTHTHKDVYFTKLWWQKQRNKEETV